eukprot:7001566-Ditylum_brightwellii.AAC.1
MMIFSFTFPSVSPTVSIKPSSLPSFIDDIFIDDIFLEDADGGTDKTINTEKNVGNDMRDRGWNCKYGFDVKEGVLLVYKLPAADKRNQNRIDGIEEREQNASSGK